jgi:hypothetical protein
MGSLIGGEKRFGQNAPPEKQLVEAETTPCEGGTTPPLPEQARALFGGEARAWHADSRP